MPIKYWSKYSDQGYTFHFENSSPDLTYDSYLQMIDWKNLKFTEEDQKISDKLNLLAQEKLPRLKIVLGPN